MKFSRRSSSASPSFHPIALTFLLMLMMGGAATSQVDISQKPVSTSESIPGNLLLVPSVEWPTINSVANLGDYTTDKEYAGYFDPNKCYVYVYKGNEEKRRFKPSSITTTRTCSGKWSGNFLNWAATQTIDPFRSALTGGYRVKDTATSTWLEKARHDGQGGTGLYPNRRLPASGNDSTLVQGATPFNANWIRMRIQGLGNKMRFRLNDDGVDTNVTSYDPANAVLTDRAYELSVRVHVCKTSVGVEPNCKEYSEGWKPEGTIQEYADSMRYGIFGFLNDSDILRDGGVLRAQQKWVGPTNSNGHGGEEVNVSKEWDGTTGVFIQNPDSADASATNATINDSGVINYLNKFGQMTTSNHKSKDPVSELYYSAIRYFKHQGNVPAYSNISGDADTRYKLADGFPVITDWDDPILHWCQKNVILGIGDIYTHRDKNLPGGTRMNDEPSRPAEVSADDTVNVQTATQKVADLEGITINLPFTGRENSAYIAGLAYDSHTKDIRPDLTEGKTTVSTYWVDVLEAQSLEGMARNQYALAAKYGGFRVPDDFEPYEFSDTFEEHWWHSNDDTLTPYGRGSGQAAFKRPDNFFIAGEANAMVESLTRAFENIYSEIRASSTSAAASSAVLETDTLLYTAGYRSNDWSGTLEAREVQSGGALSCAGDAECWDAEATLRSLGHANRNIFTRATATGTGAGSGVTFQYNNLDDAQKAALNHRGPDDSEDDLGSERVAWLRGNESAHATFRSRSESAEGARLLGDIVNSDPQLKNDVLYVGANDGMMHAFHSRTGVELFAYIPSPLLLPEPGKAHAPLSRLTNPGYGHRYFMDGKLTVENIFYFTLNADAETEVVRKDLLVGSLGAGGRTVFALNVSGPDPDIEDDPWFQASDVLWEFQHADLGYRVGKPLIVRISDDENGPRWVAAFGNGYNSDNHHAVLFIVDLLTGTLIKAIDTGVGTAENPNGLSGPVATDWPALNLRARYFYAGDLQGNLWRFDLSGDSTTWGQAEKRQILFKATTPEIDGEDPPTQPQPITTNPRVALFPSDPDKIVVAFGTGSYFRTTDADDNQIQSLYGIIDIRGGRTIPDGQDSAVTRDNLLEQTIENATAGVLSTNEIFLADENGDLSLGYKGWYIDLNARIGERVISEATFPSGTPRKRVRFTTLIPDKNADDDLCTNEPVGYLYDIDLASGGGTDDSVLDMNGDGVIDDNDKTEDEDTINIVEFGRGERLTKIRNEDNNDQMYTGEGNHVLGRGEGAGPFRQSWRQLR